MGTAPKFPLNRTSPPNVAIGKKFPMYGTISQFMGFD